jgi:hypothetical protein
MPRFWRAFRLIDVQRLARLCSIVTQIASGAGRFGTPRWSGRLRALKEETAPPRTSGEDLQQARPQAEATKEAERAGIEPPSRW